MMYEVGQRVYVATRECVHKGTYNRTDPSDTIRYDCSEVMSFNPLFADPEDVFLCQKDAEIKHLYKAIEYHQKHLENYSAKLERLLHIQ